MTIPVFPYIPSFNIEHYLNREIIENNLSDGYYISGTSETSYARADGTNSTSSYAGQNEFKIKFNTTQYGSMKMANLIWIFLRARLDNINEPFYYYNCPVERNTPDLTGADPTGRYYLKIKNPSEVMSRDHFMHCVFSYNGIDLIETQDWLLPS